MYHILNDNYHYKIFIIGYFISFNSFIQFVFTIFIENDSHKHAILIEELSFLINDGVTKKKLIGMIGIDGMLEKLQAYFD